MARTSFGKILKYLQPLTRHEGIAAQEFKIPVAVHNNFPQYNEFREILMGRIKKSRRSDRSTSSVTLYEHLNSLNALDIILSEPVVEKIHKVLEDFEIQLRLRSLQGDHLSSRTYPEEFHRTILRQIHGHLLSLDKTQTQYKVEPDWLRDYIAASHRQMIREVRAMSPLYPFGEIRFSKDANHLSKFIKLSSDKMSKSEALLIRTVFGILSEVLQSAGVNRGAKELSIQLTVLFCARSAFFSYGFSAEAVRSKLKARHRLRTKR